METVVILGTGVAGCTAAIYCARANLKPLVLSGPEDGGQLTLTTEVENFPGFPEGIDGPELVKRCKKQAERFGARFETDIVVKVEETDGGFSIGLVSGNRLETKSLIVATGASARWLGIESEDRYKGRGVTTCATCDGAFYKDKKVIVVGGGDSAMEEAIFLTKFASKVTVVHRRDELRASKIMQKRAKENEKIDFVWNSEVVEIKGEKKVEGVVLKNVVDGNLKGFSCDGVFLAIGHVPNTNFLMGLVDLDDGGYVLADRLTKTNVLGIFAAGDVQDKHFRQAITAAGSGCMAAMEVEKYLIDN